MWLDVRWVLWICRLCSKELVKVKLKKLVQSRTTVEHWGQWSVKEKPLTTSASGTCLGHGWSIIHKPHTESWSRPWKVGWYEWMRQPLQEAHWANDSSREPWQYQPPPHSYHAALTIGLGQNKSSHPFLNCCCSHNLCRHDSEPSCLAMQQVPMQSLCYTTLSGNVIILCMKKFDALREDQELLEQNTFTQKNKKRQILYANLQRQMDFLPIL